MKVMRNSLKNYSEYDDDLYRAEFLNKTPRDNYSGPASTLFANRQQQAPKRRRAPSLSGNRRVGSLSQRSNRPANNHSFFSSSDNALSNFSGHVPQKPRKPWGEIIKPILSNPIASVAVVVIISYLIGFILGKIILRQRSGCFSKRINRVLYFISNNYDIDCCFLNQCFYTKRFNQILI